MWTNRENMADNGKFVNQTDIVKVNDKMKTKKFKQITKDPEIKQRPITIYIGRQNINSVLSLCI